MLVGCLTVATVTDVYEVLNVDLSHGLQWDLGVLRGDHVNPTLPSTYQLYEMTKCITKALDHTRARAPHLPSDEAEARRATFGRLHQRSFGYLTPRARHPAFEANRP